MIPRAFGFPLWIGISRRVAKKYFNRWGGFVRYMRWNREFADYKTGDVINDCTSMNNVILEIRPEYYPVGHGAVLIDIDFQTTGTGASLRHCGIERAKPREEVVSRLAELRQNPMWADVGPDGRPGRYRPDVFSIDDNGVAQYNNDRYNELWAEYMAQEAVRKAVDNKKS